MGSSNGSLASAVKEISRLIGVAHDAIRQDLEQDLAVMFCEKPELLVHLNNGNVAYVTRAAKNRIIDKGYSVSNLDVPRFSEDDSDALRAAKIAALQNQTSINDEIDGDNYESLLPCKKYEQAVLWRKVRNESIMEWISENCPLLDYLLESDKESVAAPKVWNSKSIVRAYMGADEVEKLLARFGQNLSADEKLAMVESMFNRFMHARKAKSVSDFTHKDSGESDFFMAM
jgi:hypothetical protein